MIDTAKIIGVGSYTQFAIDLPLVHRIKTEQWDWVFVIAGVFLADMRLCTGDLQESRKQNLRDIVFGKLAAWKAVAGLHDCNKVYKKAYEDLSSMEHYKADRRFLGADALGVWMALNLLGHFPQTEDELKLGRMAGAYVGHIFFDWWDTTKA